MAKTTGTVRKTLGLLSVLAKHPGDLFDRVANLGEVYLERNKPAPYNPVAFDAMIESLELVLRRPVRSYGADSALAEIEHHVQRSIVSDSEKMPFSSGHNAKLSLAKLCYLVCRALKPEIVLETGVAHGVTSAFVLKALSVSGRGMLHSVDLPPLVPHADAHVGHLVPPQLRDRWCLHRGATRRVLPTLLSRLPAVDVFIHDSLHTYRNIRFELQVASGRLSSPAVVVADDIENNAAWYEWVASGPAVAAAALQEPGRNGLYGVAVVT